MEIEYIPPEVSKEFFNYYGSLTGKDQKNVENKLNYIETINVGHAKTTKILKALDAKNKIFEFIIGDHRITATPINKEFWILHGFRKKSQKTPLSQIEKAKRIKNKLYKYLKI